MPIRSHPGDHRSPSPAHPSAVALQQGRFRFRERFKDTSSGSEPGNSPSCSDSGGFLFRYPTLAVIRASQRISTAAIRTRPARFGV